MEFNSAGVIPLMRENGTWKVFLIQHNSFQEYWSCPKGHLEPNEASEVTARRELKEETNLEIKKFLQKSPLVETFTFIKNGKQITKRILYYIAEVEGNVILQKNEIRDGKWFSLKEAIAKIKHPEGKDTFSQVEKILF